MHGYQDTRCFEYNNILQIKNIFLTILQTFCAQLGRFKVKSLKGKGNSCELCKRGLKEGGSAKQVANLVSFS